MIDKNGRGILNDWDHSVKVPRGGNKHAYRTVSGHKPSVIRPNADIYFQGTWQFISIELLRQPSKHHDILDDIESCFWVLLYVSFIHFELERGVPRFNLFNEYNDDIAEDGSCHMRGGQGKQTLISTNEMKSYQWKCPALNWLIRSFVDVLKDLAHFRSKADNPRNAAMLETVEADLRTVDPILKIFDEALASDLWIEDRRAVPVEKSTKKREEQKKLLARTETYTGTSGIGRSFSIPTPLPAPTKYVTLSADSSRGSSKRSADEAAVEDAALVEQLKQIVKKARTERPPSKEPDQTPAQGHRYQTRSKTKSNESQAGKKRSQDVVMKGVEHSYGTRSKSKPKPRTVETQRPPPRPKPAKKTPKQPPTKRNNKRVRAKKQPEQANRLTQK